MKPKQLHHASVRVADLQRSREFYEKLIGLEQIERPELGFPGAWYGVGAGELHLIQNSALSLPIDPTGPHFAIQVGDLEEARRQVKEGGLEVVDFGGEQFWIRDPDGYTVEITSGRAAMPGER
jgi:catechol 2,3-dioxygenase-like lactoylglutathione lyase family enzyme